MKNLIKILFTFIISLSCYSQNIVPKLDWREVDFPAHFPNGIIFDPNTGHQTQEESAEDWWYDIVPMVDEQGRKNGFIAAGYATWLNLKVDETINGGCYITFDMQDENCNRPITDGQEISSKLNMIGKYDLAGNMLWCKTYSTADEGAVSVTPTSDGGYVFVGGGRATRNKFGDVIPLNPSQGNPGYDISSLGLCTENAKKTLVGKINSDGDLLWLNQYSFDDVVNSQSINEVAIGSDGLDVIEMLDGKIKVLAVSGDINSTNDNKFFLFNLEANGELIPNSRKLIGEDGYVMTPRDIDSDNNGNYYISGGQNMTTGNNNTDAVLFKVNDDNEIQPFSNYPFSGSKALIRYNTNPNTNKHHVGQDVRVLDNGKIAWSLTEDCTGCRYSGTNIGQGKVMLFDPSNSTFSWIDIQSINSFGFNDIRAFDLKMGLTETYDGGFALVTSVQSEELTVTTSPFDDFITQLDDSITGKDCAYEFANDEIKVWNTDAYVAKFDGNGNLLWDKTFDSDDQAPAAHPGDMKKQECLYRIAEAEDGSLAIVGNTSHNIDDYYIAKIGSDCNLNQYFHIQPEEGETEMVFDSPNQPIILNTTTYGNYIRMKGKIIIKENTTVIIDGLRVEFADSRKSDMVTKLIVERGAKLELKNGAKLTSITDCPGSMWDGVEVWGNKDEVQSETNQGKMVINNSTIENSIFGVTMIRRIGWDKQPEYAGGILIANNSNFVNNVRSVEFGPYIHYNSSSTPVQNASQIIECNFTVDGLNDPEQYYGYNSNNELKPRSHDAFIYLDGIYNVKIQGNNFTNNDPIAEGAFRGKGIYAWNSTFKVVDYCLTNPPFGQPCPVGDRIPNVFENLYNGIHVRPMGSSAGILIKENEFKNNDFGIVFEGSHNFADIHSNSFRIDENIAIPFQANGGIYLESASGFKIENNTFEGITQSVAGYSNGIHIGNSSYITASEVYRNEFDLLDIGIQSTKNNLKMEVDCNTFTHSNDGIDWHNAADGLVNDQGLCDPFDPEAPQANFFGGSYSQSSDYQIFNQGAEFEYSSYSDVNYLPQNSFVQNVIIENCISTITDFEEVCPSRIPKLTFEEHEEVLEPLFISIGGINDVFDHIENTASGMIININEDPIDEVYNLLIAESPHLPDNVLNAFINEERFDEVITNEILSSNVPLSPEVLNTLILSHKITDQDLLKALLINSSFMEESVLITLLSVSPSPADFLIEEVLITNSPLQDATLLALLTKENPVSNYVIRNVLVENTPLSANVNTQFLDNGYPSWVESAIENSTVIANDPSTKLMAKTPLQTLMHQRDFLNSEASKIVNSQVRKYLQEDKIDSAIIILESRESVESSLALLPILKLKGDTEKLNDHLNSIENDAIQRESIDPADPMAKEERAIATYYDILFEIENSVNGFENITDNQINQIELKIEEDIAMSSNFNNLLVYANVIPEERKLWSPVNFEGGTKSSIPQNNFEVVESTIKKDVSLLLFPNPTKDKLNINYTVENESGELSISIYNMLGREVFQKELLDQQGSVRVKTTELSNGIYIVNLKSNQGVLETQKLVIQN